MTESPPTVATPTTNYFHAMDLPVRMKLDARELEERYHALSRALHPDYHQQAAPAQQKLVLEKSATLNQAYRVLRDPMTRAEHLLALHRPGAEKGADTGETPKALLTTVFELQEIVEEAEELAEDAGDAEKKALRARLEAVEEELDARTVVERAELAAISQEWDGLEHDPEGKPRDAAKRDALLDRIGVLLNERAYLRRLRGNIAQAMEKLEA